MAKALIIGAGAIGRGFLPWIFTEEYQLTYFDSNTELTELLAQQNYFTTHLSDFSSLHAKRVFATFISSDEHLSEEISTYDLCFISVGPRNVEHLPLCLSKLECPAFSLENDSKTVDRIREKFGLHHVYFGVPDVISSCTASQASLAEDPLSLHTEDGVLYLDSEGYEQIIHKLNKTVSASQSSIDKEWDAKLYLHNTPHCIAAYLGYQNECDYLHEAMSIASVRDIVEGVIEETLLSLKASKKYDHKFLESYAQKEVNRFSDPLLFDPVKRVARHPLRKLRRRPNGRLLGALEMCVLSSTPYQNILTGIVSALSYMDPTDDDFNNLRLINSYGPASFLHHFLGIHPDDLLNSLVSNAYLDLVHPNA
jgi:mannitol-1-phosphate 5-dehydrogenase